MSRLLPVVIAALVCASPAAAASTIAMAAGPADIVASPAPKATPAQSVANSAEVPDEVLLGMAISGLLIVGIAARRRQSRRSVTS